MINNTSTSILSPVRMRKIQLWNSPETTYIMPQASIDIYDRDMGYLVYFGYSIWNGVSEFLPPINQYGLQMR